MEVTTPRLSVRHLKLEDYSNFAALESDPEVKKFSGGPAAVSEAAYARLASDPSDACLAVCTRDDGRFIGRCGFRPVDDRIELEIFLARAEQGHTFGPELFKEMVSQCLKTFPSAKVAATTSPANSRAVSLLKRHNFVDSGETVLTKAGFQALCVQSI
jgi:RimJ/RimL family protein N-acetyltransferase